jgi:hypothetical protein
MNLITVKAAAKHKLFLNQLGSEAGLQTNVQA